MMPCLRDVDQQPLVLSVLTSEVEAKKLMIDDWWRICKH